MGTRTGLDAQLGIAEESTVGTAVTVTRFYPITSESLKADYARIESASLRAGRVFMDPDDSASGEISVSGDIDMPLRIRDFGLWLKYCLGAVSTSGTGPYTHTFTPGDLFGKALTVQVGRPDSGGSVRAFTYAGVKVANFDIEAQVGSEATMKVGLIGQSESTSTSLATASYTASNTLFTFVHGAFTWGGSSLPLERVTYSGDNNLQSTRHRLGSATSTEQRAAGHRAYTLTADADFEDLTVHGQLAAGSTGTAVLTFTSGTNVLTITSKMRVDGEVPTVGGTDEVIQPLNLKAIGDTDAEACTITLVNADSTP
ncbi:MAG TPA: hypothetical protein ENI86_09290 [Acidimicrobiales bacterium]|nr:hypothetical protein [Acidimicrobiales bacterium]